MLMEGRVSDVIFMHLCSFPLTGKKISKIPISILDTPFFCVY